MPVVGMVSSGFPRDRRRQEEAGSTAAEGELGQHPTQNLPPSQVESLGSVLGMVGSHGQALGLSLSGRKDYRPFRAYKLALPLN